MAAHGPQLARVQRLTSRLAAEKQLINQGICLSRRSASYPVIASTQQQQQQAKPITRTHLAFVTTALPYTIVGKQHNGTITAGHRRGTSEKG